MKKMMAMLLCILLLGSLTACTEKQQQVTNAPDAAGTTVSGDASAVSEETSAVADATIVAAEVPAVNGYTYTGERHEMPQPLRSYISYTGKDGVYEYVFGFAPDGSTLTVTATDPKGGPYYTTVYFNSDGKTERVENGSGIRTECTYEADKSSSSTYDAEGLLTEYLEYTYTEDNKVKDVKSYDADGQVIQWTSYWYDDNGYLVQKILTDQSVEYVYEITNDDSGRPIKNIIRADGEFYGASSYTYDEKGNKLTFLMYADETLATASDTSSFAYTYNEDGTVAKMDCSLGGSAVDHTILYEYTQTVYPQYIDFIASHYNFD